MAPDRFLEEVIFRMIIEEDEEQAASRLATMTLSELNTLSEVLGGFKRLVDEAFWEKKRK